MPLERLVNRTGFSPRFIRLVGCLLFAGLTGLALLAWHLSRSNQLSGPISITNSPKPASVSAPEDGAVFHFRDLASLAGIDFRHMDGHTDMHYFPEVMG